jgi:hypothetical protein
MKSRKIKVYRQSGYDYAPVPAIVLKGLWFKDLGFEIGDCISVKCEDGKLIIALDYENDVCRQCVAEEKGVYGIYAAEPETV